MRGRSRFSLRCGSAWAGLILLAWSGLAYAQTPNNWGRGLFDEEQPAYRQAVAERERAYRNTTARIAARQKQIDDFLGSFWIPGRAAEVERSYENGPYDAFERKERLDTARTSARSAEGVYRRHRAEVDAGRANERNASTRGPLWYEHLYWLDLRNQAAEREYERLDSRLIGLRAAAGFDWFEFWSDTGDDVAFIFRDVAKSFVKETSDCFSNLFRTSFTGAFTKTIGSAPTAFLAPTGPAAIPTLGSLVDVAGGVAGCITGPAMNTWVNALASALKKQFLDEMRRKGVIEDVALFWWDTLIAADDDAQTGFLESAKKEMFDRDGLMSILKTHTEETAARVLAFEERPAIQKALAPLVDAGRLNKAGARTSALQIAEKRGKERVGDLVKGLGLGVNLVAKAATLLANSETYAEIQANELDKYRKIVECLGAQNRPINGSNVLPYFRATSTDSYVALLTRCRGEEEPDPAPPEPPAPAGPGPADVTAILDSVRGQAGDAGNAIADALGACERAKSTSAGVAAAWDNVASALTALRGAMAARPVDLPASATEAEALAREAYAAGEIVSEARTRGLREASLACQAKDALPLTAVPSRPPLRLQAQEASVASRRASTDADSGLARARAALASVQALKSAADSATDSLGSVRSAATNLGNALTAARDALGAAGAEIATVDTGLQRAEATLSTLRGQVNQARESGYDAATLGALTAELDRTEEALQSALGCPNEARSELDALAARAATIEAEAQALLEGARNFAGSPTSGGPEAERIRAALADAQASYDAADLFADSARSAADNAEACRAQADSILDPAPPSKPEPPDPPADGGWGSGEASPSVRSSEPQPAGTGWEAGAVVAGCETPAGARSAIEGAIGRLQAAMASPDGYAQMLSAADALATAASDPAVCPEDRARVRDVLEAVQADQAAERQQAEGATRDTLARDRENQARRARNLGRAASALTGLLGALNGRSGGSTASGAGALGAAVAGAAAARGADNANSGTSAAGTGCAAIQAAFQQKIVQWQSILTRRPANDKDGSWCREVMAWQRDFASTLQQAERAKCVEVTGNRGQIDQYYALSRSFSCQ